MASISSRRRRAPNAESETESPTFDEDWKYGGREAEPMNEGSDNLDCLRPCGSLRQKRLRNSTFPRPRGAIAVLLRPVRLGLASRWEAVLRRSAAPGCGLEGRK